MQAFFQGERKAHQACSACAQERSCGKPGGVWASWAVLSLEPAAAAQPRKFFVIKHTCCQNGLGVLVRAEARRYCNWSGKKARFRRLTRENVMSVCTKHK
jgi:hypothetical protein